MHQTTEAAPVTLTRSKNLQPLHAAQLEEALLTLRTAAAVSGLSVATLYRKADAGQLRMVRLGKRCTRVKSSDLREFMATMPV